MQPSFGTRPRAVWDRFQLLFFVTVFLCSIIVGKLFWLQVIHGSDYDTLAENQNSRGVVLPAKRGNIYARDTRTAELYPLAQNSTTYTIFADPLLIEDASGTASALTPLLAQHILVDEPAKEAEESVVAAPEDQEGKPTDATGAPVESETTDESESEEETAKPAIQTEADLTAHLVEIFNTKDVVRREIHAVTAEQLALLDEVYIPGVAVEGEIVTINPTLIEQPEEIATQLATILEADYDDILPLLQRKKVRYVRLTGRVPAPLKDEIVALDLTGIGALPEYRRVYPEGDLASQVVGFLNHDEQGVYGVEGTHNQLLAGRNGLRRTKVDPFNRQITVGDITINEATDGASLVLTIDRAIQEIVEHNLGKMVDEQRADSGQAIVMDPYTGAILALAHYPSFDPNNYGAAYSRENLVKKEIKHTWTNEVTGEVEEDIEEKWYSRDGIEMVTEFERDYIVRDGFRYPVFDEGEEKVIYSNRIGAAAFALKAVTEPYEPGSVFKPIVMAMALDAGEITPATRSPYSGPVEIDEYIGARQVVIKNAQNSYHGRETMTEVLANSSNIGMTFIAQQLGRATFYDYLQKFGFGERTDVDLEGETSGYYENYTKWSESELITKAFGQGITTNLIQMAVAYSALANGGLLMRPYIVAEELYADGRKLVTEPETVRRVIDAETSAEITAMLLYSVKKGYAKAGAVPGYLVAGKTGTSQTYSRSGRAYSDIGTTIAGFGGYAPASDPKFVLLVKIDRPRASEWGSAAAAPVFQAIASELLKNYFAIPPKE